MQQKPNPSPCKTILILGEYQSGKSRLLQLLLGLEQGVSDDACQTENKIIKCQAGWLYGKSGGIFIKVFDMPGLFRPGDEYEKVDQDISSIQCLMQLEQVLKDADSVKIDRIIVCADIKSEPNVATFLYRLSGNMISSLKIAVIISKTNRIGDEAQLKDFKKFWRNWARSVNTELIFFFGSKANEVDSLFEANLMISLPETLKFWSEIPKKERQYVAQAIETRMNWYHLTKTKLCCIQ